MEIWPPKFRSRFVFLQRWRLCLVCFVCLGILLSILASSFAESSVYDFIRQSLTPFPIGNRGALNRSVYDDATHFLPTASHSSAPTALQREGVNNGRGDELQDDEKELGSSDTSDLTENTELSQTRSDTGDEDSALAGKELRQGTHPLYKTSPVAEEPLQVPNDSSAITSMDNPQSSTDGIRSYGTNNSPEHDNIIYNASNESAPLQLSGQCDVSVGRWFQDDFYPLYQPGSCPYVDEGFSCQENGRPDSRYMKWRWKPRDCEIPRFNASNLLERLRGKRLVFVGDSLIRNQWESMLCLLREALANKSRMFEMHGQRITKSKGAFAFKFLDYDCRVEFYRSHFLVAEGKKHRAGSRKVRLTLRLDKMDRTARKWMKADILVFTTGHWWTHGKTAKGRDYCQEGDILYGSLPVMVAFKKALTTWGSWVDKNVDPKSTKVFFCGYSPAHFSGGQWNSGGQCQQEVDPIFNDSYIPSYPEKMLVLEDIIGQMKTPVSLLNVTRFSEYRKDAHPSIYGHSLRQRNKNSIEDCSHWCLPGLPDIWNEILYASLIAPH